MKIIGVLSWYDEPPRTLMAAVTAMSSLLDHLVAVDGGYVLFPGAMTRPASSIDQSLAVADACAAARLAFTLHRPSQPFHGNEVEKRNLTLRLAETVKESDDDWVVVFDADTVARPFAGAYVRRDLEESNHLVAEYGVYNDPLDEGCTPVRGIYRLVDGLEYGPAHYWVSAPASDGGRVWLWGQPQPGQMYAEAFDLTQRLTFDHRRSDRSTARLDRAAGYYDLRDKTGAERISDTLVQGIDGEWRSVHGQRWANG